ncbi:MAG: SH3 domain-containing protein [Clostridia bacterium]|nr:SH3 domain-containing protein [Clostridia bacterium]
MSKFLNMGKRILSCICAAALIMQSAPLMYADEAAGESSEPSVMFVDIGSEEESEPVFTHEDNSEAETSAEEFNETDNEAEIYTESEIIQEEVTLDSIEDESESSTDENEIIEEIIEETSVIPENESEPVEEVIDNGESTGSEESKNPEFDKTFAQAIYDPNFRAFLREYSGTSVFASMSDQHRITADELTLIENITEIDFSDENIKTDVSRIRRLDGIELFKDLEKLNVADANLTSIDFSSLKILRELTFVPNAVKDNTTGLYLFDIPKSAPFMPETPSIDEYSGKYSMEATHGPEYRYVYYPENNPVGINVIFDFTSAEEIARVDLSSLDFDKAIPSQKWTGNQIIPNPEIKDSEKLLVRDVDYTLVPGENKNIGKADITVCGRGNYYGSVSFEFNIIPQDISIENIDNTRPGKIVFNIKSSNPDGVSNIIKCSENDDMSSSKYFSSESDTVSAVNLEPGKTYYFQAYAKAADGETGYYSSKTEKYSVSCADESFTASFADGKTKYDYTGIQVKPQINVYYGENLLTEGTDYTLDFTDNIMPGKADVEVVATGNRNIKCNLSFSIYPAAAQISSITCSSLGKVEVTLGKTYPDGTEFVLQYSEKSDMSNAVTLSGTSKSFTVSGLTDGTVYYFRAYARYKVGEKYYTGGKSSVKSIKSLTPITAIKLIGDVSRFTYNGKEINPAVSVQAGTEVLTKGSDYTVSYKNNISCGTATITVKGVGSYGGTLSKNFTIVPKSTGILSYTNPYPGTIRFKLSSSAPSGVTYTVRCSEKSDMSNAKLFTSSSTSIDAGGLKPGVKYYVQVWAESSVNGKTYKSDYSSKKTVSFEQKTFKVALKSGSSKHYYSGKSIKPSLNVYYGDTLLTATKHYSVSYRNNILPGKASVTVTALGDSSLKCSTSFKIYPPTPVIKSLMNKGVGKVRVVFDGVFPEGTVYCVQYSLNADMSDAKTVSGSAGDITVSGLRNGKKYYFRTYTKYKVGDSYYYSGKSGTESKVTLIPLDNVKIKSGAYKYTYNGKVREPSVEVTAGGKILAKDTDYTVSYKNNRDCGTATITVKGIGKYTGTITKSFAIVPKTPVLTKIENTKSATKLDVYFTSSPGAYRTRIYYSTDSSFKGAAYIDAQDGHGEITGLKENTRYYIKMKSYIKYGSKGTAYYSGTSAVTSEKTKRDITKSSAKLSSTALEYNGKARYPSVTVTLGSEKLVKNTDYSITYKNNKDVGRAYVYIRGIGDYAGTITRGFYVIPQKPVISSFKNENGKLKFSFSKPVGAVGVKIYYATNSSFKNAKSITSTGTSASVSNIQIGETYFVKMRAYFKWNDTVVYGNYTDVSKTELVISKNWANLRFCTQFHKTGFTDSEVIKLLPSGANVQVLNNEKYLVKVRYNGVTGYITKYSLNMGPKYDAVTTRSVNVYTSSSKTDVICTLNKNSAVTAMSSSGSMTKVKLSDGSSGYVVSSYLKLYVRDGLSYSGSAEPTEKLITKSASLNVRQGPGDKYSVIGNIKVKGSEVTILDRSNSSWYLVRTSDGLVGYCYSLYIGSKSILNDQYNRPSGAMAVGIDVSEHNGDFNLDAIKDQVDFVVIRCGYGSNYSYQDDKEFYNTVRKCERLGIPYGVYLYSYADTVAKAKSEAEHTLRLLKGTNPTLGVWYDVEDTKYYPSDAATFQKVLDTYVNTVSAAGYKVGIYTYLFCTERQLKGVDLSKYRVWMAQYWTQCQYRGDYVAWQFTSTHYFPEIPGIPFDLSWAFPGFYN